MHYTLCIPVRNNQILLGKKTSGFLEGKYNGFGGKIEPGESVYNSAVRELQEECDITPTSMDHVGVIYFDSPNYLETGIMHVFKVIAWEGIPKQIEKMIPQWFDNDKIPYDQMCTDDPFWFPLFLEGKTFEAKFKFGEDMVVLEHEVIEKDLSDIRIHSSIIPHE